MGINRRLVNYIYSISINSIQDEIYVIIFFDVYLWSNYISECSALRKIRKPKTSSSQKCWMCKKSFANITILNQHKQSHTKKKFGCQHCSRLYASKFNLNQHVRVRHKGLMYKCTMEDCGKLFQTHQAYMNHKKMHQMQFTRTCEVCGKGFIRKDHFEDHILRHTKEKPFRCNNCNMSFFRKQELKRHLQQSCNSDSHPKVECPICGKMLKNKDTLRNHRKNVHEEGKKISCPHCSVVSSFHQSTIDRHIKNVHLDILASQ